MAAEPPAPLDLARGLPVSCADVRALRAARLPRPMSGDAYLAWLRSFPAPDRDALRRRDGPRGEPFRLP
ncbi:MAG: hypothetical protein NDJ94_21660 [Vicinamibacteria bacterium]|nr:hypothetical protein [Vicinamibacteria bacterium]